MKAFGSFPGRMYSKHQGTKEVLQIIFQMLKKSEGECGFRNIIQEKINKRHNVRIRRYPLK